MNRRELLAGAAASAVAAACRPSVVKTWHRMRFAAPGTPSAHSGIQTMGDLHETVEQWSEIFCRALRPDFPRFSQFAKAPMGCVTRTCVDDSDLRSEIVDGFYIDEAGPIPRKAWDEPMPHLLGDSVSPLPYHEDNIYDRLMTSTVGNPFRTF